MISLKIGIAINYLTRRPEKSKISYLPNEAEALLNMMETVFRDRENTRCILLSNATSVVNPYFLYFGLMPNVETRFNHYEDRGILIELCDSKEFAIVKKQTPFGKLIQGTAYEEEWAKDMKSGALTYPQGQMIKVNMITSLQKIIQFMGKERACDRAQQEIENWYVNVFLPEVIAGLKKREEYQEEAKYLEENYINRCRCAYPDYTCPNPCGHPRVRRPF